MIIDDDVDDIDFFCEAIEKIFPFSLCLTAKNGVDALAKLDDLMDRVPDFIFLDLNMPCMDGKTCLAHLKKDIKLKNIPVIIYTTSSSQKHIKESRELGASYFLTKPISFKDLCDKIKEAVEKIIKAGEIRS